MSGTPDDGDFDRFSAEEGARLQSLLSGLWSSEDETIRLDLERLELPGRPK